MGMAYNVMAYIVMAYTVMAYRAMAYVFMSWSLSSLMGLVDRRGQLFRRVLKKYDADM